jgi:hypothetical protein
LLCTLGGLVAALVLGAVSNMASEEIRARLRQLPHALLRLAVRQLPAKSREELGNEWCSELAAILDGTRTCPSQV